MNHYLSHKDFEHRPTTKTVIFFGADGTGKSTQAEILLKEFKGRRVKARKAWIRARHSLAYIISQILLKLGYKSILVARDSSNDKILDPRLLPAKWLWSLIEFISVIPWMITRVYMPLLLGYHVVAERYVIDTIVYNQFFIGESFNPYTKILLRMIPKDALLIHMDANIEDVLKRREGDILPESFIEYLLKSYRLIAAKLNALTIKTTSTSIEEAARIISQAHQ